MEFFVSDGIDDGFRADGRQENYEAFDKYNLEVGARFRNL